MSRQPVRVGSVEAPFDQPPPNSEALRIRMHDKAVLRRRAKASVNSCGRI